MTRRRRHECQNFGRKAVLLGRAPWSPIWNARTNILAPVINVSFNANLWSLAVAQQLYGDATREPDLTARNDASNPGGHPGFMPRNIEALAQ
jgi:hypothetical protein